MGKENLSLNGLKLALSLILMEFYFLWGESSGILNPRTGQNRCGNWNSNNKKPWKNKATLNNYFPFLFLWPRKAKGSWLLSAVLPFSVLLGNQRPLNTWFWKPCEWVWDGRRCWLRGISTWHCCIILRTGKKWRTEVSGMPGCSGQDRMSGASGSHKSHGVWNQAGRICWSDNHIPSSPHTLCLPLCHPFI